MGSGLRGVLRALAPPDGSRRHGRASLSRILGRLFVDKFPLQGQINDGVFIGIGALPPKPGPPRVACDLGVFRVVGLRLAEHDPWPLALGGIGQKQTARLEPPFIVAELADVEDVAGPQREAVEHRAVLGVGVLAPNPDIDLADPIALAFGDVVDEVELARLLEKPRVGLDVGEDEATAAVDVPDQAEVGIHLRLVEGLTALELEVPGEKLALELAVADEGDVADGISRPLVDHEGQHRPVAAGPVDHLDLPADLRLEEAEAAIVGGQQVDVLVDLLPVDVTAEEPEYARLRFDLGEQSGIAGDRVADETGPE